jgi:hypothetical protein
MPVFTIETPSGKKLDIEAADETAAIKGAQEWEGANTGLTSTGNAVRQGAANVVSGLGETLKQYGPEVLQSTAEKLKGAGASIAPDNYQSAPIVDKQGVHLGNVPNAVAEAAPGMATGIGAAKLMPGPWWAKLLAGAGTYAATSLGGKAKERAAARTGDEAAEPNTSDKAVAGLTMIPEAALGALGISRFLPGAGRVAGTGLQGVAQSGRQLLTTAGIETGVGAGQNIVSQVGRTAGTPGGLSVDPIEVANSAATQGVTGAGLAAPKFGRDVGGAVKYREAGEGNNAQAYTDVANRMQTLADGRLSSPRVGAQALTDAITDVKTELRAARAGIPAATMSPELGNALKRAALGKKLNEDDHLVVEQQAGPTLGALVRQSSALANLKSMGTLRNGRFTGGVSAPLERSVRALQNPIGAGAAGAISALGLGSANMAAMFTAAPAALGAIGGVYGGARLIDRFTGNRSPVNRFVQKFAENAVAPRPNIAAPRGAMPPPPQQQPPAPPPGPQGPPPGPQGTWGPNPQMPPGPPPPGPRAPQPPTMPTQGLQGPQATQGALPAPAAPAAPSGAPQAPQGAPPAHVAALLKQITAMQQNPQVPQSDVYQRGPTAPAAPKVITKEAPRAQEQAPKADTADDGPVPFSTTLKHAKIDHRDYAVADEAAASFAASPKPPPPHVVGLYRESTAFRQARERDRLLEMSKDPAFPHDDMGFQDLVSGITKVRDREDVAQLVKDVMEQYPAHGTLAHRYFHPAWAASLWNKSKSSRKE